MSRSGLAVNAPRDAPKLLSLLNSTLSSSHELVRSLSIVSQPSTSLLKPIKRNLTTVAAGISALQDEQIILEQEGKRSKVSLEEVRRKEDELIEVKGAWDRLCEVLNKHETTAELLTDVKENHPNLFEAIQTKAATIETISPYRDDPAHKQSNPYAIEEEEDGRSNAELLQSQQQQMASQDNQLDHLSASIGRQHHLSLQMNEELETHATLLDEMDRDVENTGARLGRASRRLDQFTNSLKEHGSTWTIFVLIIILVMLIAIFK